MLEHKDIEYLAIIHNNYHEFKVVFIVLLFLFITAIVKLIYNKTVQCSDRFSYIPESCILLLVGIAIGCIVRFAIDTKHSDKIFLTHTVFFELLLPPIILEASYQLYTKKFNKNVFPILVFAVFGTLLNWIAIAFVLHHVLQNGNFGSPTFLQALVFSSLIAAVDPVAVLAIFNKFGIDSTLHYNVFGESLFNDAVTIVLYKAMHSMLAIHHGIDGNTDSLVYLYLIVVPIGSLIVGVFMGIICSLQTKYTHLAESIEPAIILMFAFASYMLAEAIGWSGIISMFGCGLVQAAYAFKNISPASKSAVRHFIKSTARLGEAVIFLYLGVHTVTVSHVFEPKFIFVSLALCITMRAVMTVPLSMFSNCLSLGARRLNKREILMVILGGIRGAVSFSLAAHINTKYFGKTLFTQQLVLTATIVIILFTVIIMGFLMKAMLNYIKIKLVKDESLSVFSQLNSSVVFHTMAGMEEIAGCHGSNWLSAKWQYIRNVLLRHPVTIDADIVHVAEELNLKIFLATEAAKQDLQDHDHGHGHKQLPEKMQDDIGSKHLSNIIAFIHDPKNRSSVDALRSVLGGGSSVMRPTSRQEQRSGSKPIQSGDIKIAPPSTTPTPANIHRRRNKIEKPVNI